MPLPMSRQAMTGLEMPSVQELLELNRAVCKRKEMIDMIVSVWTWLVGQIYIYICLLDGNYIMDGFCQVSAWFFYWNYIMPYDNHDKHDNEYLYNITNQTFMAHNPSPWEMIIIQLDPTGWCHTRIGCPWMPYPPAQQWPHLRDGLHAPGDKSWNPSTCENSTQKVSLKNCGWAPNVDMLLIIVSIIIHSHEIMECLNSFTFEVILQGFTMIHRKSRGFGGFGTVQ